MGTFVLIRPAQTFYERIKYCGKQVGLFERRHSECQQAHQAGWKEMVSLAAQAATNHTFDEHALRRSLSGIAHRSYAGGREVEQALEEGWKQGVAYAMTDGIISRQEEERLRAFRDQLALEDGAADPKALDNLDRASTERLNPNPPKDGLGDSP